MALQGLTESALSMQFSMLGGMDYDSRPHLVEKNKWRLLFNMRTNGGIQQVARKKQAFTIGGSLDVQALVNLPVGRDEYAYWLGLTKTALHRLTEAGGSQINGTAFAPCDGRWSTCVYNGRLFFVNENNRVMATDGASLIDMWELQKCASKDNGEELLGTGPFTAEPLFEGPPGPSGEFAVVGDLNPVFTWTTDSEYRVYVERPHLFEFDSQIEYHRVTGNGTSVTLSGTVLDVRPDFLVVRADNTVANVPNADTNPPGVVRVAQMSIPSGRYARVFYDHLIVGAPTYHGIETVDSVMWSDLRDFAQWTPRSNNEADSYLCTEYQRLDSVLRGVTGLQLLGNTCLIFTSSCIYSLEYVGLPRVMQVNPLLPDYGNGLRYATVALDGAVAWYDVHHAGFYIYRGQGPESLGDGINDYFAADLNPTYAQKTFAYLDRLNSEVVWAYMSTASSGTYDKAVAFNYDNKTWSVRSVEDTHCFARVQKRCKTVGELSGTCAALTGTAENLEQTTEEYNLLWGSANGAVLTEAASADADGVLLSQTTPYMETGDLLYGSAQRVKEVNKMTINATADSFTGIKVEVDARDSVDDTVSYTNVGTWTPTIAEKMLTFATEQGKVLRYRFTPQGTVRDFVFSGFEDNILSADAFR